MDFTNSVFQGFEEDSPELLKKMMTQDYQEAGISRLFSIGEESDRVKKAQIMMQNVENEASLKQVLNKFYLYIKNLYISIASASENFEIDLKLFSRFVIASNLMDKEFNTATVSKVFIASNVSDTNPDKIVDNILINRPEFLGCIVRLAHFKYHEMGTCKTLGEATEKILTEDILTRNSYAEGIFFRAQNLYSNPEVEALLKANEDLIKSYLFASIESKASCWAIVQKAKLPLR